MRKVRIKDIRSFIEGNFKYFRNKFLAAPDYINDQILLSLCKDDCLKANACKYCSCPPRKKVWVVESCNNGERFPDLMNKEDWGKFVKENNIKIQRNDDD